MQRFKQIIKKYKLEDKAEEIAQYITSKDKSHFSADDFAKKFNIKKEHAQHILDTIYKAVELREKWLNDQKV